jgi:hypothetical protein
VLRKKLFFFGKLQIRCSVDQINTPNLFRMQAACYLADITVYKLIRRSVKEDENGADA